MVFKFRLDSNFNSGDPSAAYGLGLHGLPMSHKTDARW